MTTTSHTTIDTALGALTLVNGHDGALRGLYFPGHWHLPAAGAFGPRAEDGFSLAATQLREYLAGERSRFELTTATVGEPFQERVWALLRELPYGETTTYGELARELGYDASMARAVGGAVARNPISIVIPCHRVLGSDGKLTGYAGGLDRKRALLALEARGRG